MNFFFDTSSFFKLYHEEAETKAMLSFLEANPGYSVVLSTLIEMYSSIFKKVRIKQASKIEADRFIQVLVKDFDGVRLIPVDTPIINYAQKLMLNYGLRGLRSLDAIQLASAITVKDHISLAITHDSLLKQFLTEEGISCF